MSASKAARTATTTPRLCIHDIAQEQCCLCNGYVRWLIADEERLRRAQANPEAARREYRGLDYELF